MIGRRQAKPWWLSAAGERGIKDNFQFFPQFPPKGPAGKIPHYKVTPLYLRHITWRLVY